MYAVVLCSSPINAQSPLAIRNADGLRMFVAPENTQPTLRIQLPGSQENAIEVIFPEHVTVRKVDSDEAEHLYLFSPGREASPPQWRQVDQSLEYEMDLKAGIHFLARATLVGDGVLFHYEFLNRSNAAFAMIYAVTDPRLTSIFHDVRLERTYVHHKDGFDLLASETPSRLTMEFLWPSSIFLLATDGSEKSLGSFVIVSGAFLANAVLFGLVGALLWPLGRQIAKLLNLLKRPI